MSEEPSSPLKPKALRTRSVGTKLTHGAYRAKTEAGQRRRLAFIEELCRDLPVHLVTVEVAKLAGRIEGQQQAQGIRLPFEDLLIGTTALSLGYSVATANVRHFRLVPNLEIIEL